MRERFFGTRNITVGASLTAISFVLYMFVKFPLPFMFPAFLDVQFSDMPALIGGFMMGPTWGCVIIVLKCLLKLPFSTTSFVGEAADMIVGVAFVLPSALFYKFHRSKKGAALALLLGSGCAIAASLLANAFILIPFYSKAFGWDAVVGMLTKLFPKVSRKTFYLYYLPLSVLPFNILRCAVCALITFFVYKHLRRLIDRMFAPRKKPAAPPETDEVAASVTDQATERVECTADTAQSKSSAEHTAPESVDQTKQNP